MGLIHEFYLLPANADILVYKQKAVDKVIIHDDLIQYMMDSLNWIPSINPSSRKNRNRKGINYHGHTLFDRQSAEVMKAIFTSWRDLFKNGPQVLTLRGNFVYGENEEDGDCEKLVFNHTEIIRQLEKIISMSDRMTDGNFYLYHRGI